MLVLSSAQMREWDRRAQAEYRIPGEKLMEYAGLAAARVARERLPGRTGRVHVFCGQGGNGGDGLVLARYLHEWGFRVKVFCLFPPENFAGDSQRNFKKIAGVVEMAAAAVPAAADQFEADLLVDALFGTGFTGPLSPPAAELVRALNAAGVPIMALDAPSGVDATTAAAGDPCIRAAVTVTFGEAKTGLLFPPAKACCGELIVAAIGLPPQAREKLDLRLHALSAAEAAALLPASDPESHKFKNGKLLVLAGSRAYTGAAALACRAAQRMGSGYIRLLAPESVRPVLQAKLDEVIVQGLPEQEGEVDPERAIGLLAPLLEDCDALALGPGCGRSASAQALLQWALLICQKPLVIDADSLPAAKNCLPELSQKPHLFTPHRGEMEKLLGWPAAENSQARAEKLRDLAGQHQLNLLLKGPATLNCNRGREVYVNLTGNPGLAKAGSGDVLTGIIAALASRKLEEKWWGPLAAFLHGLAADLAAKDLGELSLTAGDVIDYLPRAILALQKGEIILPRRV